MKIEWTETHECEFDLEQAVEDFHLRREFKSHSSVESDIHYAIQANLSSSERIPNEVYEKAEVALKHAIGGIQLEMDLDNLLQKEKKGVRYGKSKLTI